MKNGITLIVFCRLDYVGISLLVIGSFIPWIHYSFYCYNSFKLVYILAVLILGGFCAFVCTQDYFLSPTYRAARARKLCMHTVSAI